MDHPSYVQAIIHRIREKRGDRFARPNRLVAKEIGIAASTLSRLERGNNAPDLESFRKICVWLEVSADELLELKTR